MTFGYAAGESAVVCAGSVAVIASIDPHSTLARRLYEALVSGGTVDDALDVLCSEGLRAVADFGVLEAQEGRSRVVLRGRVVATGRDGAVANESGPWRDVMLGDDVALGMGSAGPAPLMPLASGIAMAGAITTWRDPALVSPATRPVPAETPVPIETPATQAEAAPPSTPAAPPDASEPSVPVVVPGTAVWEAHEAPLIQHDPAPAPESVADEGEARAELPEYDFLLGLTTRASDVLPAPAATPEAAPSASVETPQPTPSVRDEGATLPAEAMESVPYDVAASQVQPSPTGGKRLLSAFPWEAGARAGGSPAPTPFPAAVPPSSATVAPTLAQEPAPRFALGVESEDGGEDELEERTVRRSALAGPASPTVPSTRCINGHLNPHFAAQCRVCRAPVPAQEPVLAPRPSLGILRATTGGTIPLERNVILGRNPHLPNGYVGEQPSLIKVSDSTKGISTQHAEVRLDGWLVSVRDLGSTNGTEVILPGRPPITLRAHDPLTIEPGTRVILAGVVEYVFEATA